MHPLKLKKNSVKKSRAIKLVLILFFFIFIKDEIHAQTIDSLWLIPSPIVNNQETKLVIHSRFSTMPATFDSSDVEYSQSNDSIGVKLYYSVDNYPAFCDRIDTVSLGTLNQGLYNLSINTFVYKNFGGIINDSRTINFTVGTASLVDEHQLFSISIFPNPATNQLNFSITTNSPKLAVEIVDISGRKVSTTQYNSSNQGMYSKSIDVSALNKGLYLCRFIFDNHQISRKFIKDH